MTRHKKYNVDLVRPGADKASSIEIANSFGKDIIERSMVSQHGTVSESPCCIDVNIYFQLDVLGSCGKVKTADKRNCDSNGFQSWRDNYM
jgi:hypothetical protein